MGSFVHIYKIGFYRCLMGLQWEISGFYNRKMLIVVSYID